MIIRFQLAPHAFDILSFEDLKRFLALLHQEFSGWERLAGVPQSTSTRSEPWTEKWLNSLIGEPGSKKERDVQDI